MSGFLQVPTTWRDPAEHRRKLAEGVNSLIGSHPWETYTETTVPSSTTELEFGVDEGYVYRAIGYEIEKSASSFLYWQTYESGAYVTTGYTWNVVGGSSTTSGTYGAIEAVTTAANLNFIVEIHEAGSARPTHSYAQSMSTNGGVSLSKRNSGVAATKFKIELSASATMDGGLLIVQRRRR